MSLEVRESGEVRCSKRLGVECRSREWISYYRNQFVPSRKEHIVKIATTTHALPCSCRLSLARPSTSHFKTRVSILSPYRTRWMLGTFDEIVARPLPVSRHLSRATSPTVACIRAKLVLLGSHKYHLIPERTGIIFGLHLHDTNVFPELYCNHFTICIMICSKPSRRVPTTLPSSETFATKEKD